jgi:hypothetical protein
MGCSLRTLASLPGATDIVLVELAEQVHGDVAAEEVRVDLLELGQQPVQDGKPGPAQRLYGVHGSAHLFAPYQLPAR